MNIYNSYSMMADLILVLHAAFIIFLVGGQFLIIAGALRNWRWVRNFKFRVCHVLCIGFVVIQAWADKICPLTIWENALRQSAGDSSYEGTFVTHWVSRLIYYEAPQWAFTLTYSIFGVIVLASWIWIRPLRSLPAERL